MVTEKRGAFADDRAWEAWFLEHVDILVCSGLMHPAADAARPVRAVVGALLPEIEALRSRIAELESMTAKKTPARKRKTPNG